MPGLLERAIELARGAGACVALELASFEVVRAFSEVRCWSTAPCLGRQHFDAGGTASGCLLLLASAPTAQVPGCVGTARLHLPVTLT